MIPPYLFVITTILMCNIVSSQVIMPQLIKGLNTSNNVETICVCFPLMCFTKTSPSDKVVTEDTYQPTESTFLEPSESFTNIEVSFPTINPEDNSEVSTNYEYTENPQTESTTFPDTTEPFINEESSRILDKITSEMSTFNDFNTELPQTCENVQVEEKTMVISFPTPKFTTTSTTKADVKKPPVIVCYVVTEDPSITPDSSNFEGFTNSDGIEVVEPSNSQDDDSKIVDLGIFKVVANKTSVFPGLNTSNLIETSSSSSELSSLGLSTIGPVSMNMFNIIHNHSLSLVDMVSESPTSKHFKFDWDSLIRNESATSPSNKSQAVKDLRLEFLNFVRNEMSSPASTTETSTIGSISFDVLNIIQNESLALTENSTEIPTVMPVVLDESNSSQKTNLTTKNSPENSIIGLKSMSTVNIIQNESSTLKNEFMNGSKSLDSKNFTQNTNLSLNIPLERSTIGSISKDVLDIMQNQSLFTTKNEFKPNTSKSVDTFNVNLMRNQKQLVPSSIVTELSKTTKATTSFDKIEMDRLKMLRNDIINKKKMFDGIIELIEVLNQTAVQKNQGFHGNSLPLKRSNKNNIEM